MKIEEFSNFTTSLKETSKDDSDKRNIVYMSKLENAVVNFDKVKEKYVSELENKLSMTPFSNDALFEKNGKWFFIEFKNGTIDNLTNAKIKMKIYDSLLVLLDILKQDIEFSRKNITYILVFNEENINKKCTSKDFDKNEYLKFNQVPSADSASRANLLFMLEDLSGCFGKPQFGLERYKNFIFNEVYTIPKYRFDDFIKNIIE